MRLSMPGEFFHVMARGDGGEAIFNHEGEYRRFLDLLADVKEKNGFQLASFCLMPNHFHFLLRIGDRPLPLVMQQLQTRYACSYNARRRRKGHVFQGRYKSIPCRRDAYFLQLVRYIHRNPVKAGLAAAPGDWHWSSHREYVEPKAVWLASPELSLPLFAAEAAAAVAAYREFVAGDGDCLMPAPAVSKDMRLQMRESDLASVAKGLAEESRVAVEALTGQSRCGPIAAARRQLIERALARGFRPSEIARYLGRDRSFVSRVAAELVNTSTSDTVC